MRRILWVVSSGSVLFIAMVVLPELLYRSERAAVFEVADIQLEDRQRLFEASLEQSGASQLNLATDYTYWDDMIEFADGKLDDTWGSENLAAGLESFHVHGIWVVNRNGTVRYGVRGTPGVAESEPVRDDILPIPLSLIQDAVARDKIASFYLELGGFIQRVIVAGIVPTADDSRQSSPQGWFVTINTIDEEFIAALGEGTGTTPELLAPDTTASPTGLVDENRGILQFWHPLTDNLGNRVAVLRIEHRADPIVALSEKVNATRTRSRVAFAVLAVLVGIVLYLLNRARARAESIAQRMTAELRELNTTLEKRIADRTHELEEDIARRTRTETELRTRTHELEVMNKGMIDRELKMVELKKKLEESGPPRTP